jgi:hypothetical protein
MRWLAYLVIALAFLALGVAIRSFWPSGGAPADVGETAPELGPPPRVVAGGPGEPAKKTFWAEGEGNSPEQNQALTEAIRPVIKELINKAVANAVNQGLDELQRKLRIADDVERKLLFLTLGRWPEGGPELTLDSESPLAISIHLIRPGKADQDPETLDAAIGESGTIRFTRVTAPVERPVAVATMTGTHAGRLWQRELFLAHGADNEWHAAKPTPAPGARRPADAAWQLARSFAVPLWRLVEATVPRAPDWWAMPRERGRRIALYVRLWLDIALAPKLVHRLTRLEVHRDGVWAEYTVTNPGPGTKYADPRSLRPMVSSFRDARGREWEVPAPTMMRTSNPGNPDTFFALPPGRAVAFRSSLSFAGADRPLEPVGLTPGEAAPERPAEVSYLVFGWSHAYTRLTESGKTRESVFTLGSGTAKVRWVDEPAPESYRGTVRLYGFDK